MTMNEETQSPQEDTWETQEVINFLINDEDCWNYLKNKRAHSIRSFVREEKAAPPGLYESIRGEPGATWRNVNWTSVAAALKE
jgi:hypothetical protein